MIGTLVNRMTTTRVKLIKYFSLPQLFLLFAGKFFSAFRNKRFLLLQEMENKLQMLGNISGICNKQNDVRTKVQISQKQFEFTLRLQGSDILVFNQVIRNEEYGFLLALYQQRFGVKPANIVDAGANIGLTTIYFKAQCPDARIVAIEPDEDNISMASTNFKMNGLENIELIHAALWPSKNTLSLMKDFRDRQDWSFRVEPSSDGKVKAITPREVLMRFLHGVDIFKMDIEGSERFLLREDADREWVKAIKILAVEIHDEFDVRKEIINLLQESDFRVYHHGEMTVFLNLKSP